MLIKIANLFEMKFSELITRDEWILSEIESKKYPLREIYSQKGSKKLEKKVKCYGK